MALKTNKHHLLYPSQEHTMTEENWPAYEYIEGDWRGGLLLICDHACNAMPPEYQNLGLCPEALCRHIAYDIGMAELTRALAARLSCPAVLSTFSRLLIDPNRGEDDPTILMRLSDGAVIPGNRFADEAEKARRISRFHRPYHEAIEVAIERMIAAGKPPLLFSLHSFTPLWRGWRRPWHASVLWDKDSRVALPLIKALRAYEDLCVGDNVPYTGALKNDTLYRHGTKRGLPHALLEVRQDLVADSAGVEEWAERITPILKQLLEIPNIHEFRPPNL